MKKLFGVGIFWSLFVSAVAQGGIIHLATPDQEYRDYGAQFSSVAGLFGHTSGGGLDWLGSATVIDENWAMASAHQINGGVMYESYSLRTGTSLYSNLADGIFYSSSFAVTDPSYTQIGQGRDISLIRFDTPITGVDYAELYTGAHTLGSDYSMVGFGATGFIGGAPATYDYSKRGFQNVMDNFGASFWTDDYISYTVRDSTHPNFRELGGLLRPGDSGGGWFVEENGQYYLGGISSSAFFANDYGSKVAASKIDVDWVNSYIGSSTAVPEPSSIVLMGSCLGLLGISRLRKRRELQQSV